MISGSNGSRQKEIHISRDDTEYSPAKYQGGIALDKSVAHSGSTLAVYQLIQRCDRFYRAFRSEKRRSRPGRYQNLMAAHWLTLALVAFTMLDEDCEALDANDNEHEPTIDLDGSTERAPSLIVENEDHDTENHDTEATKKMPLSNHEKAIIARYLATETYDPSFDDARAGYKHGEQWALDQSHPHEQLKVIMAAGSDAELVAAYDLMDDIGAPRRPSYRVGLRQAVVDVLAAAIAAAAEVPDEAEASDAQAADDLPTESAADDLASEPADTAVHATELAPS